MQQSWPSHCTSWFLATILLSMFSSGQEQILTNQQQFPPIKVEVQLVTLTATVEDSGGRAIVGLKSEAFQVFEDRVPQQISVFHDDEKVPVSVGILFDTSGSMVDKIEGVKDAVLHFIDTTDPEDDIFLIRFSNSIPLVQELTNDRQQLRRAVGTLLPGGGTALYDAVISGLEHLQLGQHKKKALLIVTDGNDTTSQVSLREAVATAQQSEAIIYALGIGHGEQGSFGHLEGMFKDTVDKKALESLTDTTGGRTFILEGKHYRGGVDVVDQAAQQVGNELRDQYTLAYHPSNRAKDGTYRHIQVKLVGHPEYTVRTREGYLAPRE